MVHQNLAVGSNAAVVALLIFDVACCAGLTIAAGSEILENEILAGTENTDKPTEEVSQYRNHGQRILSEPVR